MGWVLFSCIASSCRDFQAAHHVTPLRGWQGNSSIPCEAGRPIKFLDIICCISKCSCQRYMTSAICETTEQDKLALIRRNTICTLLNGEYPIRVLRQRRRIWTMNASCRPSPRDFDGNLALARYEIIPCSLPPSVETRRAPAY